MDRERRIRELEAEVLRLEGDLEAERKNTGRMIDILLNLARDRPAPHETPRPPGAVHHLRVIHGGAVGLSDRT